MKLLVCLAFLFSISDCAYGGGGNMEAGENGGIIIIVFFLICAAGGISCILCCDNHGKCNCGRSDGQQKSGYLCQLCQQRIPEPQWKSGEHRRQCAIDKASTLSAMTRSKTVSCPQCKELLRLWPRMGAEFYCDNNYRCKASNAGNPIVNTGINRCNCFICDIDYCLPCIEDQEKNVSSEGPRQPCYLCYLCQQRIPEPQWKSGEHQRQCAIDNASTLSAMTRSKTVSCPKCKELLRLWPAVGAFYCDNIYHFKDLNPGIVTMIESIKIEKRYKCFKCDIDYCIPCIEDLEKNGKISQLEGNKPIKDNSLCILID